MPIYTYSYAKVPIAETLQALYRPPASDRVPGLIHAQCLTRMTLAAPIFSPERMQLRRLTMFASWESESAIDDFLANNRLGQRFASGWHLRMSFLRRWGEVKALGELPENVGESDPEAPVAAFTLARMRLPQVPRFIRWGKPVEALVRDHPEATLSTAAMRLPNTVSTFSVWTSQSAMTDMVRGHSHVPQPSRHADAMKERNRKDFHFEFTTLRFKPISEHGAWDGRTALAPTMPA